MSLYRSGEKHQDGRINKLEKEALNNVGTSAQRPKNPDISNAPYFDTTIGMPIWWDGTNWVNAAKTIS